MSTVGFLLAWALYAALVVIPFRRILPAHGWPKQMAIIAVFPAFALALLWLVAFGDRIPQISESARGR